MYEDIDKKLAELDYQIHRRSKMDSILSHLKKGAKLTKSLAFSLNIERIEYEESTKRSIKTHLDI